jgi:hypothetical protein
MSINDFLKVLADNGYTAKSIDGVAMVLVQAPMPVENFNKIFLHVRQLAIENEYYCSFGVAKQKGNE